MHLFFNVTLVNVKSTPALLTSNTDAFFEAFNSKVLMYLFEDAGKMHQKKLFAGIDQNELTFSKVCEDFKTRGTAIFGNSFQLVKE